MSPAGRGDVTLDAIQQPAERSLETLLAAAFGVDPDMLEQQWRLLRRHSYR